MCFYLRWAVRSSSVIQAPRGLFSSGTLAVTRVLVLNRMWRTGCLFTHTEWLCVVRMVLTLWSLKCLVFLMTELSLIQLLKNVTKMNFLTCCAFPRVWLLSSSPTHWPIPRHLRSRSSNHLPGRWSRPCDGHTKRPLTSPYASQTLSLWNREATQTMIHWKWQQFKHRPSNCAAWLI